MSTEKFNMVLKLYPIEIQKSAKKREIWIHKSEGEKIPRTVRQPVYKTGMLTLSEGFSFNEDGWVIRTATGEKVVRNFKTAGKPNMKRINGQSIWDGDVSRYERNDLKKFLSEYFIPNINRQLPEKIMTHRFIQIEFIFYTRDVGTKAQDIDNHSYVYVKAFLDALQDTGRVTDDGARNIRGYYCRYIAIAPDEDEERRLEIKIHFCTNDQKIE